MKESVVTVLNKWRKENRHRYDYSSGSKLYDSSKLLCDEAFEYLVSLNYAHVPIHNPSGNLIDLQLVEWMDENVEYGDWVYIEYNNHLNFFFTQDAIAVQFKLAFCEKI